MREQEKRKPIIMSVCHQVYMSCSSVISLNMQVLLDHSPSLLCLADKNGLMPIHHAAARETADYMNTILTALKGLPQTVYNDQQIATVVFLEKSLLEVDCKDDQGRTPLHYATLYNNLGVVQVCHAVTFNICKFQFHMNKCCGIMCVDKE